MRVVSLFYSEISLGSLFPGVTYTVGVYECSVCTALYSRLAD